MEYFELLVQPNKYYELFIDFICENIESSIEEFNSPYPLVGTNHDISDFDLSGFYTQGDCLFSQIIVRTLKSPAEALHALEGFRETLCQYTQEEVSFGFGYRKCKNQDWIELYKQSIEPVAVGKFYIRPSWHKSAKELNLPLEDVMINPALAFGSGHHASTSMCLALLEKLDLRDKSLLDLGCGSGILGICSAMMGAEVDFCDTDELAIQESLKNFTLNAQSFHRSWVGSIPQASQQYEVIVANILAHIIIMLHPDFLCKLVPRGILILSGILQDYKEQVLEAFCDFEVLEVLQKDEWVALKLCKI